MGFFYYMSCSSSQEEYLGCFFFLIIWHNDEKAFSEISAEGVESSQASFSHSTELILYLAYESSSPFQGIDMMNSGFVYFGFGENCFGMLVFARWQGRILYACWRCVSMESLWWNPILLSSLTTCFLTWHWTHRSAWRVPVSNIAYICLGLHFSAHCFRLFF